jgi:hypothetical protein
MVTGNVDALECVLRKIGIDQSEFTVPTDFGGTGRVQLFINNGADISGRAPSVSQLVSNASRLAEYDMVLFACQGFDSNQASGDLGRVLSYANAGGRVFATHYSYNWLDTNAPFSGTANWAIGGANPPDPLTAVVDQSFPRGMAFAQWLQIVGASAAAGQVSLNQTRHDFNGVVSPSTGWLYSSRNTSQYLHYTFNTPVGSPSADQCGRVLFSDFHVTNANSTSGYTFPSECNNTPMTAQEKVLEFMLFDLASCVAPTSGVTCATGETVCHTQCCAAGQSCMTTSTGAVCFQPYPATATFAQTVDASASCGAGEQVSWNNLVFVANAPAGTSIDITFYTAATSAGLATATGIPLGTYPATTSPIDLAAALTIARQSHNLPFAKVVFTLHSDSTHTLAPVLDAYQVNFNCAQST